MLRTEDKLNFWWMGCPGPLLLRQLTLAVDCRWHRRGHRCRSFSLLFGMSLSSHSTSTMPKRGGWRSRRQQHAEHCVVHFGHRLLAQEMQD